jgi:ParB-like chromosome segregation protein Spo0J
VFNTASRDIVDVDLRRLKLGMSPRFGEQDLEHAQALSFRLDDCPPILVERSTSTVIDGVHRVLAAKMLRRPTVPVRYFDGTPEEAFVEAVKANVTHGKPLTLAEREAAAVKLLGMHNDWSNRLVGEVCGLSDKTVGRLRKTTADLPQLSVRIGRDGRHRPIDSGSLRNQIATTLRAMPAASPEEVAQRLATSPSTVRDVQKRIRAGNSPAPSKQVDNNGESVRALTPTGNRDLRTPVDWRADRAILSLSKGNEMAEWLEQTKINPDRWQALVAEIPLGRIHQLAEEAEYRAAQWTKFAAALEARARKLHHRT